jgi:hypothetical protein
MKRYALALALLLCTAAGCDYHYYPDTQPGPSPNVDPLPVPPAPQEKPFIEGPESVEPGAPLFLTASLEEGSVATWVIESPDGMQFRTYQDQHEFASAGPMDAKEVRVALSVARIVAEKIEQKVIRKTITVKGQEPIPPPTPPEPPVPPTPPPSPAPIPARGLHVLLTVESGENLTPGEQAILYGEQVRNYLESKCQKYTDGSRAFRIYEKDTDVSEDWPVWRDAMARPRTANKWIVVSNGVTGYEGPLPGSPEEALALIQKYEVTP